MKKLVCAGLLGACIAAHASYKQEVMVCMNIIGNTSPYSFEGRFYSSDFFDHGTYMHSISNGLRCMSHKYKHGPKSITLSLKVNNQLDSVLLVPNKSCDYVHNNYGYPGWLLSKYQKTNTPTVSWLLTLTQGDPIGMYKYVYYLDCERFAEPT